MTDDEREDEVSVETRDRVDLEPPEARRLRTASSIPKACWTPPSRFTAEADCVGLPERRGHRGRLSSRLGGRDRRHRDRAGHGRASSNRAGACDRSAGTDHRSVAINLYCARLPGTAPQIPGSSTRRSAGWSPACSSASTCAKEARRPHLPLVLPKLSTPKREEVPEEEATK